MKLEYLEDNGAYKEKIIDEEKAVRNKFVTNQVFGGSIRILKKSNQRGMGNRNIRAFVVVKKVR